MPTLNIGGQKVKVGDEFMSLSPEQQNAAVEEIAKSLPSVAAVAPKEDVRDSVLGKVDSFMRGAADTLSFGLADEISAGMGAATGIGGTFGDYSGNLARQRGTDKADQEDRAGYRIPGQVAGAVTGGVGLAKSGLSLGANAAQKGLGLGRVAMGSAADGAILGAAQGAGSGEGVGGRVEGAAVGGTLGGVLGGAAPYVIAGASKAASPLVSPVMSRLRPDAYSNKAIAEGLRRSGSSVDDIVNSLKSAADDGQGVFTVADAMGNSGQRMLSTVARNPSDARQSVVDALTSRQMGQGDRLSSFLAEGFGAPDTAAQRVTTLTAQRAKDAAKNYGAARAGSSPVDPSAAIKAADDFINPGNLSISVGTDIADNSIEASVRRARSYLTDGKSVLTDFKGALRAKQEIDAMIEGAKPAVQSHLIPIKKALDDALSVASPEYAAARDTFRTQSKTIDAVGTGTSAASGRVRASDTVPAFNGLGDAEKSAFRAGYVDPLIGKIESASVSPTTNKARLLMSEKTGMEFPAFAVPGKADQLGSRIAREQRMFETSNAALGGSKTADNLADAADMSKFDPSIMGKLFSGRPVDAAISAVTRAIAESQGMSKPVVERIAQTLMERNPDIARQLLTNSKDIKTAVDVRRAITSMLMTSSGAAGAGRLTAP